VAGGATKKGRRETTPSVLRQALLRKLGQRIVANGEVEFPCVPALLETYMARLIALFESVGKPFSDDEFQNLKRAMDTVLTEGFRLSPQARAVVAYRTQAPPEPGIVWRVRLEGQTMDEMYASWVGARPPPLFGAYPDAKVMAVAKSLEALGPVSVLDVGAGTGRNAIPLARAGYAVTALEPVPAFVVELRKAAAAAGVSVAVLEGSALSPELRLPEGAFKLAVLSEVVTHARNRDEMLALVSNVAAAVAPEGRILFNAFVALEGYKPDPVARQVSDIAGSAIFTRGELAALTERLPLDLVSDESAHDYERAHLPAEAWPPTLWFEDWAHGRNVFALPPAKVPLELRWLEFRHR